MVSMVPVVSRTGRGCRRRVADGRERGPDMQVPAVRLLAAGTLTWWKAGWLVAGCAYPPVYFRLGDGLIRGGCRSARLLDCHTSRAEPRAGSARGRVSARCRVRGIVRVRGRVLVPLVHGEDRCRTRRYHRGTDAKQQAPVQQPPDAGPARRDRLDAAGGAVQRRGNPGGHGGRDGIRGLIKAWRCPSPCAFDTLPNPVNCRCPGLPGLRNGLCGDPACAVADNSGPVAYRAAGSVMGHLYYLPSVIPLSQTSLLSGLQPSRLSRCGKFEL